MRDCPVWLSEFTQSFAELQEPDFHDDLSLCVCSLNISTSATAPLRGLLSQEARQLTDGRRINLERGAVL